MMASAAIASTGIAATGIASPRIASSRIPSSRIPSSGIPSRVASSGLCYRGTLSAKPLNGPLSVPLEKEASCRERETATSTSISWEQPAAVPLYLVESDSIEA